MVPGLQTLAELFCCVAPDRAGCVKLLEGGAVVGVAPGGAGQSMLGLDWSHRRGYAVVGVKSRVPVLTLVTDNIDIAYTASSLTYPASYLVFRWVSPQTQLPPSVELFRCCKVALAPVYGGLPVKLTSELHTCVRHCHGDPNIVHHLVHHNINSRLTKNNTQLYPAISQWFSEELATENVW